MKVSIPTTAAELIRRELDRLDEHTILFGGQLVKPSQCYRFSLQPPHVLYNTNCPEDLMERVDGIISKYKNTSESSA